MNPAHGPTGRAAQASLTRLAAVTVSVGLLWLAGWIAVAPPERGTQSWTPVVGILGALALLAAVPLAAPLLPWQHLGPWVCAASALAVLALVKDSRGLQGWWLTLELAAYVALVAGMALTTLVGEVVAAAAVIGVVAATAITGSTTVSLFQTPIAGMSAVTRTAVVAGMLIIGAHLLRRAARRTDELLRTVSDRRAELAASTHLAGRRTQVRRFLHDSGLNDLEAVARGVPRGSEEAMRLRCSQDAERWMDFQSPTPNAIAEAFGPGIENARMLGILVTATFEGEADLPPNVLDCLAGAAAEALRNAAKYSGCEHVTLIVRSDVTGATVEVRDQGRGFDPAAAAAGLGLTLSVRRRLADIGGTAEVDSAPGRGTAVRLHWPAIATATAAGATVDDLGDVLHLPRALARLSWVPIGLVALASLVAAGVNRSSVAQPWLIAVIGLAMCAAAGLLVHRWLGGRLSHLDLAWILIIVAAGTMATPIADPFCSATTGSPLIPDGRLLPLALLGVLLASRRVSVLSVAVALGSLAIAAAMWATLWPPCATETVTTAVILVLLGWGAWVFGRAVRDQQASARATFDEDVQVASALAQARSDALVRAQWRTPAVAEARAVLRSIGDGSVDLADPLTRAIAADRADRLRSAVQLSEVPDALGRQLAGLIEAGRAHLFPVRIGGNPGDVIPPTAEVGRLAASLADWRARLPTAAIAAVDVTCARTGDERSLLIWAQLRADHTAPTAASATTEGPARVEWWSDDDGWWWQAEWRIDGP